MDRLPLRYKLILLAAPTLLLVVAVTVVDILNLTEANRDLQVAQRVSHLVAHNSALVHELQKERGLSAGYLGNRGEQFAKKLKQQRNLTDAAFKRWEEYLASRGGRILDETQRIAISEIENRLLKRDEIRNRVDQTAIELAQALKYYTGLNGQLLAFTLLEAQRSQQPQVVRHYVAYDQLLQAKERAGIERAVLSNAFAAGEFKQRGYDRFINLVSRQQSYLEGFARLASEKIASRYNSLRGGDEFLRVEQLRQQASTQHYTGGRLKADAVAWFDAATQRIDLLKQLDDEYARVIQQVTEVAHAQGVADLWKLLLTRGLVVVLAVGLVGWLSGRFSRRAESLVGVMKSVSEQHDLRLRAAVEGNDEITRLASHYNEMLESFSTIVGELNEQSHSVASAAEQVSCSVVSSEQTMNLQLEQTKQLQSGVQKTRESIERVNGNIDQATTAADEACRYAAQGMEEMTLALAAIQSISTEVDRVEKIVVDLSQRSDNIAGVLEVIKLVAEQTNLLALNAAIEAARAGEQGRGFAVVADEVRALAQRTQHSADEIEQMLVGFRDSSNTATQVVAATNGTAETAVESTQSLAASLRQIEQAIAIIRDRNVEVDDASKEQALACAQFSEVASVLTREYNDLLLTTREIATASADQARNAAELKNSAGRFVIC